MHSAFSILPIDSTKVQYCLLFIVNSVRRSFMNVDSASIRIRNSRGSFWRNKIDQICIYIIVVNFCFVVCRHYVITLWILREIHPLQSYSQSFIDWGYVFLYEEKNIAIYLYQKKCVNLSFNNYNYQFGVNIVTIIIFNITFTIWTIGWNFFFIDEIPTRTKCYANRL